MEDIFSLDKGGTEETEGGAQVVMRAVSLDRTRRREVGDPCSRVSTSAPESKPKGCLQGVKSCDVRGLFPPAVLDAELVAVWAGT